MICTNRFRQSRIQLVGVLTLGLVALSAGVYGVGAAIGARQAESMTGSAQSDQAAREGSWAESERPGEDALAGYGAGEVGHRAMALPEGSASSVRETAPIETETTDPEDAGSSTASDSSGPERPTALGQFNPGGRQGGSDRRGGNSQFGRNPQQGGSRSGNNSPFNGGNQNGGQGGVYIAPTVRLQSDSSGNLSERHVAATANSPKSSNFSAD